jgi:hypothetical protein
VNDLVHWKVSMHIDDEIRRIGSCDLRWSLSGIGLRAIVDGRQVIFDIDPALVLRALQQVPSGSTARQATAVLSAFALGLKVGREQDALVG